MTAPINGLGVIQWTHQIQCRVEPFERSPCVIEVYIAVIQWTAVVAANNEKAQSLGIVVLKHLTDGEKITQTFGHFFIVNIHKTVVDPIVCGPLAIGPCALCDFVFMVRELQIGSTSVNIKCLTQQVTGHGRALNVPPGTTLTKRCCKLCLLRIV